MRRSSGWGLVVRGGTGVCGENRVTAQSGARFASGGRDEVEADEVGFFAAAVFGNLEQIEDAEKSRGAGKLGRNVGEADGFDGLYFDMAFFHRVAPPYFDAWRFPDADAQGDVAAAYSSSKALGEHHEESLREPCRIFYRCVEATLFRSAGAVPCFDAGEANCIKCAG